MRPCWIPALAVLAACGAPVDTAEPAAEPSVTTAILSFTPQFGGAALEFSWAAHGDDVPAIDPISIPNVGAYAVTVRFRDDSSSPPEELTGAIEAEGTQHQVFFTGTAVESPSTGANAFAVVRQSYADADASGYDLGLANSFTTLGTGSGDLTLTLRYLPELAGDPTKTADLATRAASAGVDGLPGETLLTAVFPTEVVSP